MSQKKQPAATLAFNRQHCPGTVPTRVQAADLAQHQQAASWQTVLSRVIPTDASRADAMKVLDNLVSLIQQRRWDDLRALAYCVDEICAHADEYRRPR